MQSNVSIVILMIVFVLVGMVMPLYNLYERQDDISYMLALKSTSALLEEIKLKGYVTEDMYNTYVLELFKTSKYYDITFETHKKILIEDENNPGEYIERYKVDYNENIFEKATNPEESILGEKAYLFNKGDQVYIKLRNADKTMADRLLDNLINNETSYKIVINLGGVIVNDSWRNVEEKVEEFGA